MTTNRSSEEFEMRRCIEAWGRQMWPGARLVHELVVAQTRRIDMAFIGRDYLVGVEIKSSRDTLDRLKDQIRVFRQHIPLVLVALAPKWKNDAVRYVGWTDLFEVEPGAVHPVRGHSYYRQDRRITVQMLDLLWAEELRSVAQHVGLSAPTRTTMVGNIGNIAHHATGAAIVREVCRALRARDAFPKNPKHPPSDPPVLCGAESPSPVCPERKADA
ncbi:MAG: hypothetical protein LCH38_10900 [Proteobacteria bacterium]|nr:hypothetical protein [Pseudomonadota bacterium]